MNIIEKMELNVKNAAFITDTESLSMYVKGYIQGMEYQITEEFFQLTSEDIKKIDSWIERYYSNPYFFTFGSLKSFPYQNGFIVIYAKDIKSAARIFKSKFPNPMDSDVLLCSDYYTKEQWKKIINDGFYNNKEPFDIF